MHVADDLVILEPADADGNVVPYGQPADRMLLTNLFNLTQPLIRYDLADAVTITDDPCPCGCAHRRITSVHGRINGAFEYDGGAGCPARLSSRPCWPPPASPTSSSARRRVVSTCPW